MNKASVPSNGHDHDTKTQSDDRESKLDQLAKHVDPPGRDATDNDLKDPGRMTPGAAPTDNRS